MTKKYNEKLDAWQAICDGPCEEDGTKHRVIVQVEAITGDEVTLSIDAWSPTELVTRPRSILPDALPARVGVAMLAEVNIGASAQRHLVFSDFELAPQPDPSDGLGQSPASRGTT